MSFLTTQVTERGGFYMTRLIRWRRFYIKISLRTALKISINVMNQHNGLSIISHKAALEISLLITAIRAL